MTVDASEKIGLVVGRSEPRTAVVGEKPYNTMWLLKLCINSYDKIKIKLKTVKLLKNTNNRYSKFLHGKKKHSKGNKAQI